MVEAVPWAFIVILIALFIYASILSLIRMIKNAKYLNEYEGEHESSGWEMRKWFYIFLFIGTTGRLISLLIQAVVFLSLPNNTMKASTLGHGIIWVVGISHFLPSFVFLSMYSLLIMFWAQLCFACWGTSSPWIRRVFFLVNSVMFSSFLGLIIGGCIIANQGKVMPNNQSNFQQGFDVYWKGCNLVAGLGYSFSLIGLLYYGLRVIVFFRQGNGNNDLEFDPPGSLKKPHSMSAGSNSSNHNIRQNPLYSRFSHSIRHISTRNAVVLRITTLCVVCSILFGVQGVLYFTRDANYLPSGDFTNVFFLSRTKGDWSAYVWTLWLYVLTECVPIAIFLILTQRKTSKGLVGDKSETDSPQHSYRPLMGSENKSYSSFNNSIPLHSSGSSSGSLVNQGASNTNSQSLESQNNDSLSSHMEMNLNIHPLALLSGVNGTSSPSKTLGNSKISSGKEHQNISFQVRG